MSEAGRRPRRHDVAAAGGPVAPPGGTSVLIVIERHDDGWWAVIEEHTAELDHSTAQRCRDLAAAVVVGADLRGVTATTVRVDEGVRWVAVAPRSSGRRAKCADPGAVEARQPRPGWVSRRSRAAG